MVSMSPGMRESPKACRAQVRTPYVALRWDPTNKKLPEVDDRGTKEDAFVSQRGQSLQVIELYGTVRYAYARVIEDPKNILTSDITG
jgi:hypothetical protein